MLKTLLKKIRFSGGKYSCNVCKKKVRTFFRFSNGLVEQATAHGFPYSFRRMETLNFDLCNCPFCLSSDRERLYLLYLEQYVFNNIKDKAAFSLLDFAPNPNFSAAVKKKGIQYLSADLFRTDVDLSIDICNMSEVDDKRFDFIICSHILEHVPNPDKALVEIYRILKPGGKAIIMVPLFWDVQETLETPTVTAEERWKYFGQDDHVRLFAQHDFVRRIKLNGFHLTEYTTKDFDATAVTQYAIAANSVLYVVNK